MKKYYSSRRISGNSTQENINRSGGNCSRFSLLILVCFIGFLAGLITHVRLKSTGIVSSGFNQPVWIANSTVPLSIPVEPVMVVKPVREDAPIEDKPTATHNSQLSKEAVIVENGISSIPSRPISRSFISDLQLYHHEYLLSKFTFPGAKSDKDIDINYMYSPASKAVPLTGVVLLLHGCSAHHQFGWYPKSDRCKNCTARPLEVMITKTFYINGYATVSTEPLSSKCWSDRDSEHLGMIIREVYTHLKLEFKTTPLFGFGVGNGAKMLMQLSGQSHLFAGFPITAVVCLNGGLWSTPSPVRNYSPMLFVDMMRNVDLCIQNNLTISHFLSRGVPAEQVSLLPQPITPDYFYRYQVLALQESISLQQAFLDKGVIWPGSLILIESPFGSMSHLWKEAARTALPHIIPDIDNLDRANSALFQLVSMAWGLNEVTPACLPKVDDFYRTYCK